MRLGLQLHQPRLWFITGGYLVKRWFITAAARARGQSNDLNREILASNLFNCHKEVINAPPVPSISRCIHIVYRHKNVWEYQWSNFIYNCMSTFLHYVHCKDALLDCSAPGGERCESLTWVDEIGWHPTFVIDWPKWASYQIRKIAGLRMHRECRERFPRHHGLAIPTCITERAWRTCRDACRGH